jgi:hypothetical protein
MMLDLVGLSPNGADLEWRHPYNDAQPYRVKLLRWPSQPYTYAANNLIRYVDPNGLYAATGYGHFCGPRSGKEWDGTTELDCLDLACKAHDMRIGPVGHCLPFTFRLTYRDEMLRIKAYYCAAWGCNTAACRAAAVIIGAWMALPGGGTFPVLPILR